MDESATLLLHQVVGQQGQIASDMSAMRSDVTRAITHLEVFDQWRTTANTVMADHESRLRVLERWKYTLAGMVALGGAAAGIVGNLIAAHIIR